MKKTILLMVVSLLVLLFSFPSMAEEKITLASCEWEPYAGAALKDQGFASEIVKEAFKKSGYSAELVILPWARALKESEEGKYDGLFNAYNSPERAQKFAVSDPYIESPLVLCALKGFAKDSYSSIKDFEGLNFGIVRGYDNTAAVDGADYIKKDTAASDNINMAKLLNKRTDLIVIDKFVAQAELQKIKAEGKYSGEIKFLEPPLEIKPVHVMFPKANANHQIIMEAFNQGLKIIKTDGTLQKIKEKHGFSDK